MWKTTAIFGVYFAVWRTILLPLSSIDEFMVFYWKFLVKGYLPIFVGVKSRRQRCREGQAGDWAWILGVYRSTIVNRGMFSDHPDFLSLFCFAADLGLASNLSDFLPIVFFFTVTPTIITSLIMTIWILPTYLFFPKFFILLPTSRDCLFSARVPTMLFAAWKFYALYSGLLLFSRVSVYLRHRSFYPPIKCFTLGLHLKLFPIGNVKNTCRNFCPIPLSVTHGESVAPEMNFGFDGAWEWIYDDHEI